MMLDVEEPTLDVSLLTASLLVWFLIAVYISSFWRPTRVKRSAIRLPLTLKSS